MIERRVVRFEAEAPAGLELPFLVACGDTDAPRVTSWRASTAASTAHIAAVVRLLRARDPSGVRVVLTAVPIVNLASLAGRRGAA